MSQDPSDIFYDGYREGERRARRATWGKVLLLLALAAAWGYAGWRSGVIKGKGWRAAVIESGCHLRCPAPGGAEFRLETL